MSETEFDIAVIGGGPAGYSAALRASKLGARVALIEKGALGGACLNRACIPTKTILHSLSLLRSFQVSEPFGIVSGAAIIDLDKLRRRKDSIVSMMTSGVAQLLDESGIRTICGAARLSSPNSIEILKEDGTSENLKADKIIIATGSVPSRLNVPGAENAGILYSSDLLELKRIPSSLAIVGAGPVGVELASIFNGLGSRVTLLEKMQGILPDEDSELTRILERALKKDGVQTYTGAQIESIETLANRKRIHFVYQGVADSLNVEAICAAIGQKPFFEGLGLPEAGVKTPSHGIAVDTRMQTSVPGIYAAGDVAGLSMLAYTAEAEGRVAADNAMVLNSMMDYSAVPRCVFTSPELAGIGLTQDEALTGNLKIKCLRSNMAANASATIIGERRGLVKIVVSDDDDRILGVHILGVGASNMLAECALAVGQGMRVADLAQTLHLHPTLSEAVWDAALSSDF